MFVYCLAFFLHRLVKYPKLLFQYTNIGEVLANFESPMSTAVKGLTPEQALEEIKKSGDDVIFLDVRTPEEFAEGHQEKAINIPVNVFNDSGAMVPNPSFIEQVNEKIGDKKDSTVICTCFAGRRGNTAAEKLIADGFDSVANVVGGMGSWAQCGLECQGEIKNPNEFGTH